MANGTTTMPNPGTAGGATAIPQGVEALLLQQLMPLLTQQKTVQSGGAGDVSGLQQLLQILLPTTTPGGMDAVIKSIYQQGFQDQMPKILGMVNQAGLRPGSATQQQLLTNDLAARLAQQGALAVNQQQQTAAQTAQAIAQNTKTPVVKQESTGINMQNALPALLIAGATQILGSGKKKKASGDVVNGTGDFDWTQVFSTGSLPEFGFPTTTGGINPGAGGGNSFSVGGTGSDMGGDFLTATLSNLLQGGNFDSAANAGATSAVMYSNPYTASIATANKLGEALGVNEITQLTDPVIQGVSDLASGAWQGIKDLGSGLSDAVGCYITTAVCEASGKPDDCDELQTLRSFRDNWLAKQPGGEALVQQYYEEAPKFLAAMQKSPNREAMLSDFRENYINPAVLAVKRGRNNEAFKLYTAMLEKANSYARE